MSAEASRRVPLLTKLLPHRYKAPGISTTLLILGKLSTPLFARTTESPLAQFLLPTQQPSRVAKELIQHLERGKSGVIYRPHLTRLAPLLKAMPMWVRSAIQWVRNSTVVCSPAPNHTLAQVSGADEALQPEHAHTEG